MRMIGIQSARSLWRQVALASITALYLVLILTVTAFASDVTISDQAGVLDQSRVRKAASELGYPVSIYTVNNFSGSTQQFDQRATNKIVDHSNMIVIAIDTNRKHVFVVSGRDAPLTHADNANASQAFISNFKGGDYTGATISALNSLKGSLAARGSTNEGGNNKGGGLGFGVGTCLIGLLLIGGLLFFVLRRKRRSGFAGDGGLGSVFNRQRMNPDYPPPYQGNVPPYQNNPPPYQGYAPPYQGNNPPNYGPYYGSGYPPQQRGMNPLAAGGLGAAAGGLLGYELGRHQQDEAHRETGGDLGGGESGAGGDFGGGDMGSGAGGDFGGGDTGSGDMGSGAGGDFGGGDTGSGSGGNF